MTLAQLERAEQLIRISKFLQLSLEETFRRNTESAIYPYVQQLLDDGQFYILFELKHAERHALRALEHLSADTEYLRTELEQSVCSLQALFQKVEVEESLRRDRDALLSCAASEGLGELYT